MASATSRPERVLGLHFFNPASTMRLVEVIRGDATSDATAEAGAELVRRLGKTPVAVAECPGFLVNRVPVRALCEAYRREAESGAGLAAADAAVVAAGPAPMGPLRPRRPDRARTLHHVQNDLVSAYGERFEDGGLMAGHVAAGRLGAKTGEGFFEGRAPEGDATTPAATWPSATTCGALDEARPLPRGAGRERRRPRGRRCSSAPGGPKGP